MEKDLKIASNLLNSSDKNDFNDFMSQRVSLTRTICSFAKNILENYYKIIFPWLEKCSLFLGLMTTKLRFEKITAFSRKIFILLVLKKLQS